MIIETILFLVFVTAVSAAIVKVYEWRQSQPKPIPARL
jgi:hypothetical protein